MTGTLTTIFTAIEKFGLPTVFAILMWLFFAKQNKFFQTTITVQNEFLKKSFTNVSNVLEKISRYVGRSLLSEEETLIIFKDISEVGQHEIIQFCTETLENNNLISRKEQITKNIKVKLQEIFQHQASKLYLFNSPAGDLGNIFEENFKAYEVLTHLVPIFFSDSNKRAKLNDIKNLLVYYETKALKHIDEVFKQT